MYNDQVHTFLLCSQCYHQFGIEPVRIYKSVIYQYITLTRLEHRQMCKKSDVCKKKSTNYKNTSTTHYSKIMRLYYINRKRTLIIAYW